MYQIKTPKKPGHERKPTESGSTTRLPYKVCLICRLRDDIRPGEDHRHNDIIAYVGNVNIEIP